MADIDVVDGIGRDFVTQEYRSYFPLALMARSASHGKRRDFI
jgi:hypothetical protein